MKSCLLTFCLFLSLTGFAKHVYPEKVYQLEFAKTLNTAQTEVVAPDGTRCDILTNTHAIEVDFATKWGEAIGQSLNYALQFNKRAGILLILENPSDYKYYIRVNTIIKHFGLPIDVYTISPKNISKLNIEASAYRVGDSSKAQTQESANETEYWISSTGKRHNSSCRYFKNCKGRLGAKDTGIACRICGG